MTPQAATLTVLPEPRREPEADGLRVLLVDGPPVMRAGLRALLARAGDLAPVGEAGAGDDAAGEAARLRAQVVVVDLGGAEDGGLERIARIAAVAPGARVLALAPGEDLALPLAAVRAGARGVAARSASEDDLLRAVRAVGRGDASFSGAVADKMLAHLATARAARDERCGQLTDREGEVLELLARGASTGEIALRLHLSAKTIRNHVSSICRKLRVLDRTQAALRAREHGWGGGAVRS